MVCVRLSDILCICKSAHAVVTNMEYFTLIASIGILVGPANLFSSDTLVGNYYNMRIFGLVVYM
jgi:hypothetical protein